jgi:hypothetical protein
MKLFLSLALFLPLIAAAISGVNLDGERRTINELGNVERADTETDSTKLSIARKKKSRSPLSEIVNVERAA